MTNPLQPRSIVIAALPRYARDAAEPRSADEAPRLGRRLPAGELRRVNAEARLRRKYRQRLESSRVWRIPWQKLRHL